MSYLVAKSLHIIFVVSWFAALFYIVRLFIYHVEAEQRPEAERKVLQEQYKIMQKRLWYIIGWPAMILTLVFGFWMIYLNQVLLELFFMQLKLALVGGLLIYHFVCQRILDQLKKDVIKFTSTQLRIFNEVATLFLVAIVFLVVIKQGMDWIWGTVGFFATAIALMVGIKLYKQLRKS